MKKICILSFKPLFNDPRINRQVNWLREEYEVFTLGPLSTQIPGVRCVDCKLSDRPILYKLYRGSLLVFQQFETFYWTTPHIRHSLEALKKEKPDVIVANELECLPLALKAKAELNCKVIFDAHEFYPDYRKSAFKTEKIIHRYFGFLCSKYISQADASISVSPGIIQKYKELFGVDMCLITNAPSAIDLQPSQVDKDKIKLIHHGLSMPDRHLELSIELMKYLDSRFELYLMLMPNNIQYLEELKKLAQATSNRIYFPEPVPMPSIPTYINQFDIGLLILPPSGFSYTYSLPNKFFEFIQAKLAISITSFPDMEKIVNQYQCGVVHKNHEPQEIAKTLNQLTSQDIEALKKNALGASKDLNAEANKKIFCDLIKNFI